MQLMAEDFNANQPYQHVIPCLADSQRFFFDPELRATVRQRESLTEKLVLVFPGNTGRWHYLEPTPEDRSTEKLLELPMD